MTTHAPQRTSGESPSLSFTWTLVGDLEIAIRTDLIASVHSTGESVTERPIIDLSELFDRPSRTDREPRWLELGDAREVVVLAHDTVRVEPVSAVHVHDVPPYLDGWSRRVGVGALVRRKERYAFVLDFTSLLAIAGTHPSHS